MIGTRGHLRVTGKYKKGPRDLAYRGHRWVSSPSSTAEFGEKGWDMGEPEEASATASPGGEPAAGRAEMILTPDQRVRVFISSTLGELAAERAAARRAIARLRPRPSWPEWYSTARWLS